jgi:hypothetical protein
MKAYMVRMLEEAKTCLNLNQIDSRALGDLFLSSILADVVISRKNSKIS